MKYRKSQFGEHFCKKKELFFSLDLVLPTSCTRVGPPASDPAFPGSAASRDVKRDRSGSQRATAGTRRSTIGTGDSVRDARQSRSPQLLTYVS
jgi:hypothetical protein